MELVQEEKKIAHKHAPGGSCLSVAWSGVLTHLGFKFTEDDIFGLGSGLFFGYLAWAQTKTFDLSLLAPDIMNSLMVNTGMQSKLYQNQNNRESLDEVLKSLDRNIPVAVQLNPNYCDGLLKVTPPTMHPYLPAHWVLVTGYDMNTQELITFDNRQFNSIRISMERFMEGRNTGELWNQNPKNHIYRFIPPKTLMPYKMSFKTSVYKTISIYRDVKKYQTVFVGEYGLDKLIRQMPLWNIMLGKELLVPTLQKIKMSITGAGGIKGGYRLMYSRFLENSARRLDAPYLDAVADQFRGVARLWDDMGKLIDAAIESPEDPSFWGRSSAFSDKLQSIKKHENEAFTQLENELQKL